MSSTTFDAQLEVASRVAGENPALYFEIQSLNRYSEEALQSLEHAVAKFCRLVREGDAAAFAELMETGRRYLASRI
jgi:chorismate mutase/prephenate dehydrogenase